MSEWSPPEVLPPVWRMADKTIDGAAYRRKGGLTAIISCATEEDGREWIHFSIAHKTRMPTWNELRDAKEIFLGDRYAYIVFPPKKYYVNLHPHALHLFTCREGDGKRLPEFSRQTGSL